MRRLGPAGAPPHGTLHHSTHDAPSTKSSWFEGAMPTVRRAQMGKGPLGR